MSDILNKKQIDLSIVIPCLNEEETIGICVRKCFDSFPKLDITGEVIVIDNNSTDSSAKIAKDAGAKVYPNYTKGYGASLLEGFKRSSGEYILFADGDDSYDFGEIGKFWEKRSAGDMILGSRFKGTIYKGAMPPCTDILEHLF